MRCHEGGHGLEVAQPAESVQLVVTGFTGKIVGNEGDGLEFFGHPAELGRRAFEIRPVVELTSRRHGFIRFQKGNFDLIQGDGLSGHSFIGGEENGLFVGILNVTGAPTVVRQLQHGPSLTGTRQGTGNR